MLKIAHPPFRLILLAVLGSAIILIGVTLAVSGLWQPRQLEAILPANETVALFSDVTREDVRAWSDAFPMLRTVPVFEGRLDAGVVRDAQNGGEGWILTSTHRDIPLPSANGEIYGQDFLASEGMSLGWLTGNAPRLKTSQTFRTLTHSLAAGAPYIFLAQDGHESVVPVPLQPFVRGSGSTLFSKNGETMIVRIAGSAREAESITADAWAFTPSPDTTLLLGNAKEILEQRQQALSVTDRQIEQGMIITKIHELLGTELSFAYDILPLLGGESSLSWKSGTGTSPLFLFSGTAGDLSTLRQTLSGIHGNARSLSSGIAVRQFSLDTDLRSTLIGSNPSAVDDRRESQNGWTVRRTEERGNAGAVRTLLVSGTRGNRFFISNAKEWAGTVIGAAATVSLPSLTGSPSAGGVLALDRFAAYTEALRSQPGWAWLLGDPDGKKSILWGAEIEPDVFTLTMRSMGDKTP